MKFYGLKGHGLMVDYFNGTHDPHQPAQTKDINNFGGTAHVKFQPEQLSPSCRRARGHADDAPEAHRARGFLARRVWMGVMGSGLSWKETNWWSLTTHE